MKIDGELFKRESLFSSNRIQREKLDLDYFFEIFSFSFNEAQFLNWKVLGNENPVSGLVF